MVDLLIIHKVRRKFISICDILDRLNNNFDRDEVYEGIIEEDKPDYYKTHLRPKQKIESYEKALKALEKYAHDNNIDLWGDY